MGDDEFKFLRERMVKDHIEKRGIKDDSILDVFQDVPRHRFVRTSDVDYAYDD